MFISTSTPGQDNYGEALEAGGGPSIGEAAVLIQCSKQKRRRSSKLVLTLEPQGITLDLTPNFNWMPGNDGGWAKGTSGSKQSVCSDPCSAIASWTFSAVRIHFVSGYPSQPNKLF